MQDREREVLHLLGMGCFLFRHFRLLASEARLPQGHAGAGSDRRQHGGLGGGTRRHGDDDGHADGGLELVPLDPAFGAIPARIRPRLDGLAAKMALEVVGQGGDRGIALRGIFLQRLVEDRVQVAGELALERRIGRCPARR